ncbi:hypothetical protein H0H81_009928 [Sphagnurus paluster]|uniref:DNA replication checkpoint mediator MRC1 domain-containing protein n=1 Tax=Sphagnurus paluster TaxID=117069 RepID=A0A9P7GRG9_9AGAR|nr:hypothetical protein H0H81_009928 [Sphagnurus paluster]
MPVCEDSSIVPDSTTSSPPATPAVIKRPVRTYGRPRHVEPAGDESDTSPLHSAKSSGSSESRYRTGPRDVVEEIPPTSDPPPVHSDAAHTEDEDADAEHSALNKYQFDWRKKLREIDEEDDFEVPLTDAQAGNVASRSSVKVSGGDKPALFNESLDNAKKLHIPEPTIESGPRILAEDLFGGFPTKSPTTSPHSVSSSRPGRIHRRMRRPVLNSDSEEEEHNASSQTLAPFRITSPKVDSFPTPPTSDGDDDDKIPANLKRISKGKGKAKSSPRRDVAPLDFSGGYLASTSTAKLSKASSRDKVKKQKIKAPTKKELEEISRNRSRLISNQPVSIPQTQANNKYTMWKFFDILACSTALETDQDSIHDFSSDPSTLPTHIYVAPCPPTLRQGDGSPLRRSPTHTPKSRIKPITSLPDIDEDDMDLPEVSALVAAEQEKQDVAKRHRELLEAKRRLLAAQASSAQPEDDDDSDLDIVQEPDIQMVMKEESVERKYGRKKRMSEARKAHLTLSGINATKLRTKESPVKVNDLEMLQGKVPQKGKKGNTVVTKDQLNKVLAARVEKTRQGIVRRKEEEWERRGGKARDAAEGANSSAQEVSKLYAEKALTLPQVEPTMELDGDDGDDADGSDSDYDAERMERGSASPSPQLGSGDEDEENRTAEVDADITMVNDEDPNTLADEERVNVKAPVRRSLMTKVINSDSESENDENSTSRTAKASTSAYRESLSPSNDIVDGEDKENMASQTWDYGDDKENKAVVRHVGLGLGPSFGAPKAPLYDLETELSQAPSMSPGLTMREDDTERNGNSHEKRQPFKELTDDDDPFASPGMVTKPATLFEARLIQVSPKGSIPSNTPLSFTPFIGGSKSLGFSQFDDEPIRRPLIPAPNGTFSDLFEAGTERQTNAPLKRPIGSLEPGRLSPHTKLAAHSFNDDLSLTQDVTLHPAFQVNNQLLRKADEIFEKEQEYVLETANKRPQQEPELYVNDHGFLTQTRPDVPSPEVYKRPPPTQDGFSIPPEPQRSPRRPLRTLSYIEDEPGTSSPPPLNRLHKRAKTPPSPSLRASLSPSPTLKRPNAFDIMAHAARVARPKRKLERSEFVEQEAQESDEDDMFGFGPKKNNEEEEDGEDLDQVLEALVDDKEMDEDTVAAELVIEKFKEQAEADDRELEKLHQAAIQGELRKKRRNRGVDMEDSDEDSEDEANKRIRRNMHKKQKIDRDNIKELGEHEETKSFYNVYEGDLIVDEDEFKFLAESQPLDVVMANQEDSEDEKPREVITTAEFMRRAREVAQQPQDSDEEGLDLNDVSWVDNDDSDAENNIPIKPIRTNGKKQPTTRRPGIDLDGTFDMPPPHKPVTGEGSIARMNSWAKAEGRSRHNGNTGRSVGGAAVTGHKAKSGGGSLRNAVASVAPAKHSEQRRPPKAQPSILAGVAAERRTTRFG